jgi:DNA-binding SARP family transcriptional activator
MTTHPPPTSRGHHAVRNAVAALAALVLLVAGPPAALVVFVGNPIQGPTVIGGQLTDSAVIGMLAVIVWAAWAQLMLVTAVEAIAAVRGGALPRRIPLCGFQQHLARRLVVTASLLLAGTGSIATMGAASPAVAAVMPAASTPCVAPTTAGLAPVLQVPYLPAVADAASPRRVSPSAVPVARATAEESDAERWYVVTPPHGRHHDSLWDIAERHLGDGVRWREIYDLNRHRPQPDGQRLDAAKLIQPGWRLLMPADATGIHPLLARSAPAERRTPEPSQPVEGTSPSAAVPHARSASTPSPVAPAPTVAPAGATAPRATVAVDHGSKSKVSIEVAADDGVDVPFGKLTLGLTAFACAGLAGELARRRRRAQRHRRPGERLRVPGPEAATTERILRTANAEMTVNLLREALQALAEGCFQAGRALPDLHAIQLNAERATLLLGNDEPDAVAPFTFAGPRTWLLDAADVSIADEQSRGESDPVDPYPALVALGVTGDSVLLINLEAAGTLHVAGDLADTAPILNALVAELGTSTLTSSVNLVLAGLPAELAGILDSGRTTVLNPERAAKWARARRDEVAEILSSTGATDLGAARAARLAPDIWAPAVVIAMFERQDTSGTAAASGAGLSVVTTSDASIGTAGWTLRPAAGDWIIDPLGIRLDPQRLDPASLPALADLMDTTTVPHPAAPIPSQVQAAEEQAQLELDVTDHHSDGHTARPTAFLAMADPIPARAIDPDLDSGVGGTSGAVPAAPCVLVLGPVEITGVSDDGAPGRRRRATELVAYLALHPGATQYQLDEALWPGARVGRNTRNPLVSRTRQWLGTNVDGQPYLGLAAEGGHYSLGAEVCCDWRDFCALAERGLAAEAEGVDELVAALELVRGRPFLGVNPAAYGWAEADTQDMISAIVDVAHALAERALRRGDYRRARWAASKGLLADSMAELLVQDAIRAAQGAGDREDIERLVAGLRRQIEDLDPDAAIGDLTGILAAAALS